MTNETLLGDAVEEQFKKLKLDVVAEKIAKVTKKPCGCGKRKEQLNNLHKKLRGS